MVFPGMRSRFHPMKRKNIRFSDDFGKFCHFVKGNSKELSICSDRHHPRILLTFLQTCYFFQNEISLFQTFFISRKYDFGGMVGCARSESVILLSIQGSKGSGFLPKRVILSKDGFLSSFKNAQRLLNDELWWSCLIRRTWKDHMEFVNVQFCNSHLINCQKTPNFKMGVSRDLCYFLQIWIFCYFQALSSHFTTFLITSEMWPIHLEVLHTQIVCRNFESCSVLVRIRKLNFHNLQFWNAVTGKLTL